MGINKLSHKFFEKMCADYTKIVEEKPKLGYEYELLHMSQEIMPLYVLVATDIKWYEIDDVKDLKYAEENIAPYCK